MNRPTFDIHPAHHWFAIECNNEAWELLAKAELRDAELRRLAHIAHASTFHWLHAGEPINEFRAMGLLIFTCARLGDDGARYLARADELAGGLADALSSWDRLCLVACRAVQTGSAETLAEADALAGGLSADDKAVYDAMMAPFRN